MVLPPSAECALPALIRSGVAVCEALTGKSDAHWQRGDYRSLCAEEALQSWPPPGIVYFSPAERDQLAVRVVRAALRLRNNRLAADYARQIVQTTGQTFPQLLAQAALKNDSAVDQNISGGWSQRPASAQLMTDPELGKYVRDPLHRLLFLEPPATPKFLPTINIHLLQS